MKAIKQVCESLNVKYEGIIRLGINPSKTKASCSLMECCINVEFLLAGVLGVRREAEAISFTSGVPYQYAALLKNSPRNNTALHLSEGTSHTSKGRHPWLQQQHDMQLRGIRGWEVIYEDSEAGVR